ncbi:glycosyltransferase family 1 protein [Desulfonema ishimotonii]|uniref:Glycosyltransferase family 1 protein n=1 Tax=Desulfonema ishimotonii TaxID=45657 RepID=A0A401FUK9_9BACT|nr:glycosyltransferase [Desulfonema ishimotonii]GBC60677.1 glycosyltransferase family 1 protein [Desulfonema ishimotonii]
MIDIVIVNYNSTDHLLRCLKSIYDHKDNFYVTVYVEDNASADNADRISGAFPQVILHKNIENLGFAKAVNQAVEKGRGEYVILLNPDAHVTAGFFKTALDFMDTHQDVGITGPKILDRDGRLQNSARAFPTPLTAFFGRTSFLSRHFPKNPITSRNLLSLSSDGKNPMPVDWVSGACMVVRRKAVRQVGLLDERFFMYWEDTDWCRRMWAKRWKVVYFPRAVIYHYVGGSSEKRRCRSSYEFHKSVYRLFEKYLPPSLGWIRPVVLSGLALRLSFVLGSDLAGWPVRQRLAGKTAEPVTDDKRIKVLRLISRLNVGGPSIHVYLLTKGLDRKRFLTHLVTGQLSPHEGDMSYLFGPGDPRPIIIPELQREIRVKTDIKAFFKIFRLLCRERPDIVHTHTAKAGSSTRFAAFLYNMFSRHNILTVHTFHGHVFEGYFNRLTSALFVGIERFLARISDAIIAISHTQKQELVGKYRIAGPEKVRHIELGFDLTPFLNASLVRGRFRQSLGVGEGTLLVGIVGRLVPIKNHRLFFDAARRFLEKNPDTDIRFVVVGDGELRQALEAYVRASGLQSHVIFCGWVRDVSAVYADLGILALTSVNEGTPVSVIEAMAASVPVMATDAGGVTDLLGGGNGHADPSGFIRCARGILCPKASAEGLAGGLDYLLREEPAVRDRRIARARLFADRRFGHRRLLRDIEALYMEMIGKRDRKNRA